MDKLHAAFAVLAVLMAFAAEFERRRANRWRALRRVNENDAERYRSIRAGLADARIGVCLTTVPSGAVVYRFTLPECEVCAARQERIDALVEVIAGQRGDSARVADGAGEAQSASAGSGRPQRPAPEPSSAPVAPEKGSRDKGVSSGF